MKKTDLISLIADKADITKTQATIALDTFTIAIAKTLKKGDRMTLVGFGSFFVANRSARKGRNPQTGEEIQIKASKSAKFKAGKNLNEQIR